MAMTRRSLLGYNITSHAFVSKDNVDPNLFINLRDVFSRIFNIYAAAGMMVVP